MQRIAGKGMLALLFSAFCCAVAFGQSPSAAQEIGNLAGKEWQSAVNLNNSLSAERAKMDVMLAAPGLPKSDRSLFLAYQQLLDYIKADVQSGSPVDQAIVKNYEKVLEGAPKDPNLMFMPPNSLIALVPGLLEALTVLPVPAVNTANN